AEEAARLEKRRLQDEEIARQNEKLRIAKEKLAAQEQERVAAQKRAAEEKAAQFQKQPEKEPDLEDAVRQHYGVKRPEPEVLSERRAGGLQAELDWDVHKRQQIAEAEAHYARMQLAYEEELRAQITDPKKLEDRINFERKCAKERVLMRQRERDAREEYDRWEAEDRRNNPMNYWPIGERHEDPPEVKAPRKPPGLMEAFALECLKAGLESPHAPGFFAFVQKVQGFGEDFKQMICDPRNWEALKVGLERAQQLGLPGRPPMGKPPAGGFAVVHPGVQVYPGMPMGGGGGHYQPQDEGPQVLYNQQGNAAQKDPTPKKAPQAGESPYVKKEMLPDEGKVGRYGKLRKEADPFDGMHGHHAPNDNYMKVKEIKKDDGIAIQIDENLHREVHKDWPKQNVGLAGRDALAEGVNKMREVYKRHGHYEDIRPGLQELVKQNKDAHPQLFGNQLIQKK
ncbi:MAG: hypothetical protein ACK5TR_08480, partial [Alphaproteobacteria bacterium]